MPDVPERCPLCGSEALYKAVNLYHACGTRSTPGGEVIIEGWECAVRQRDAARAEAERWRKQYEALRAGVERVADDLHMAADEAYDNWRITADFNEQGRSIGLEEAEQMVRHLLSEAGGGSQ